MTTSMSGEASVIRIGEMPRPGFPAAYPLPGRNPEILRGHGGAGCRSEFDHGDH